MIDPTRYVRKAVVDALQPYLTVYDRPPGDAAKPYGVINVNYTQRPVKGCKLYRVTIILEVYNEFREYAGRKAVDELGDNIITVLVPNGSPYISISNFTHAGCKLVSTDERADMDNSLTSVIKVMRFESQISEN